MNTIIIADLHLKFKDRRKEKIINFFKEIIPHYKRLVILGDFFEFWYGFDRFIISDYFYILHEFKNLASKNIEIHYIEGNHDFCMGNIFNELGIKVYSEFYSFEIKNKKFLAMHGDTINLKNDRFYAYLRKFLRSSFTKFLMNNLPANITIKIAENFSNTSRKYLYKTYNLEKMIEDFIIGKDYDYFISGHFHKNFNYQNFYMLGDCKKTINYLYVNENAEISYKTF